MSAGNDLNSPKAESLPPDAPQRAARNRQIAYAIGIVALFALMFLYRPWLQERKDQADLGEATIGQIDTASFVVKLGMVGGFRGLVANYLWTQANELQRQHEWDQLMATVEMITKLQPHFLSVWTFQGWNLAYNVSVEWDSPEDKYTWIKRGINFLRDGVSKNQRSPDLMWDTAWTYYHKLGFADEAIILRGLFYRDPDDEGKNFKVDPSSGEPKSDNFQVARGWFQRAIGLVDQGAQRVEGNVEYVDKQPQRKGRPDDLNFRAMPAHAQTRYAAAMEKASIKDVEPQFGEFAKVEWQRALTDWTDFGTHAFPAFSHPDEDVRIDDITNPERFYSDQLTDAQRYWTDRWAEQMHYRYWKQRAEAESEAQGVNARQLFYEGTYAYQTADIPQAVEKFRAGLNLWKDLLERYPIFRDDDLNRVDTGAVTKRYVRALLAAGESIPEDMPFKDLYEAVKGETILDPYDQLDMMRTPPRPRPGEAR